jgi:glycosyltransferase involved in cell wall biosynthesis
VSNHTQLRLLLVGGSNLNSPDEKQFLEFALQLAERGHEIRFALRAGAPEYGRGETVELPRGVSLCDFRLRGRRLRRRDLETARSFAPTLIHALYPRGTVLAACSHFSRVTGAPIAVHFGDDEWGLLAGPPAQSVRERAELVARRIVGRVHPWVWPYSTSRWLAFAARRAAAFDSLTPALAEEVTRRTGRDCAVILPAYSDRSADEPAPLADGQGLPAGRAALYTGAIGAVHEADVRLALRALTEVQRRGCAIQFVHAGPVDQRRHPLRLAAEEGLAPETAMTLGYVPAQQLPILLARASVLLQPGAPTEFNRLRLPSKLQAYLASGTPTVTFAVGFGEMLEDRREALKTYTGEPTELADRIIEAVKDEALRACLSIGGPAAARRLFDPVANTDRLEAHYRGILEANRSRR